MQCAGDIDDSAGFGLLNEWKEEFGEEERASKYSHNLIK